MLRCHDLAAYLFLEVIDYPPLENLLDILFIVWYTSLSSTPISSSFPFFGPRASRLISPLSLGLVSYLMRMTPFIIFQLSLLDKSLNLSLSLS